MVGTAEMHTAEAERQRRRREMFGSTDDESEGKYRSCTGRAHQFWYADDDDKTAQLPKNVCAVLEAAQAELPQMNKHPGGSIVRDYAAR